MPGLVQSSALQGSGEILKFYKHLALFIPVVVCLLLFLNPRNEKERRKKETRSNREMGKMSIVTGWGISWWPVPIDLSLLDRWENDYAWLGCRLFHHVNGSLAGADKVLLTFPYSLCFDNKWKCAVTFLGSIFKKRSFVHFSFGIKVSILGYSWLKQGS